MDSPPRSSGPLSLLRYEIIVHIHEVWDFSPPPAGQSSLCSGDSAYLSSDWPSRTHFEWNLGVVDGAPRRRPSVQDRSPPPGDDDLPKPGSRLNATFQEPDCSQAGDPLTPHTARPDPMLEEATLNVQFDADAVPVLDGLPVEAHLPIPAVPSKEVEIQSSPAVLNVDDLPHPPAEEDQAFQLPVQQELTSRILAPVLEPLLPTPAKKKATRKKDVSASAQPLSQRHSIRLANKPKTNLTMEEQATALLMKKSGVLFEGPKPDEAAKAEFGEQFITSLQDGPIDDYNDLFGLDDSGGVTAPLAVTGAA